MNYYPTYLSDKEAVEALFIVNFKGYFDLNN